MILRVGPYLYRVQSVRGYVRHKGRKCLGLCDNDRHVLLVSDAASEAQRVQIVCHEYVEAWLHHFGGELKTIPGKEALCDLFGIAMTQFAMDFIHQVRQGDRPDDPIAAPPGAPANARSQTDAQTELEAPARSVHEHVEPSCDDAGTQWRVTVFEPNRPDHRALATS